MCTICQSLNPTADYQFHPLTGPDSLEIANARQPQSNNTNDNIGLDDGGNANGKPVYSLDQIAYQLTTDYWYNDEARAFSLGSDRTITVDTSALTGAGRYLAQNALQAWSEVTGIFFQETTGFAQISFDDNRSGAFSESSFWNGELYYSSVNVSTSWLNSQGTSLTSYSYQTYLHEIGHALGLGHGGNYNGSGSYSSSAHYANDSWQATVMSYFSETQNTFVDARFQYVVTPQMADILAIQNLYGDGNTRSGNTTYGDSRSADASADILGGQAATTYDSGGIDHINLASRSSSQRLDLNPETFSDLNGYTGNFAIARGTYIENATTGSGSDTIIGNQQANTIRSGNGNDTIYGEDGADNLEGQDGNDVLYGGADGDRLAGNGGDDLLYGGGSSDRLEGGFGDDRLFGDDGNDVLFGGYQNDTLSGGDGEDRLYGEDGADDLVGGADRDYLHGGNQNDKLAGGTGDDVLLGQDGNDELFGGEDADLLAGGNGSDRLFGQSGDDTLTGGADVDYLIGGTGNDRLEGGGGGDVLRGEENNDVMFGGVGNDFMFGDDGNDILFGESGSDFLSGGSGNDALNGGSGDDIFHFADGFGVDIVSDFEIGLDIIDLAEVSAITSYADLQNNHISGSAAGALISVGNNSILLRGIDATDLTIDDFSF